MTDDAKKALRLRMEKGRDRRHVLIDAEEVLQLLDEIDALHNDIKIARSAQGYDPYGRTIIVGSGVQP